MATKFFARANNPMVKRVLRRQQYRFGSSTFQRVYSTQNNDSDNSMANKARQFLLDNKEVVRGPLGHAEDSLRMGTKVLTTDDKLTPSQTATVFPPLKGLVALDDRNIDIPSHRTCTIVLLGFNQLGIDMAREWLQLLSDLGRTGHGQRLSNKKPSTPSQKKNLRIVELSVVEGWLFSSSLLSKGVRKAYKDSIPSTRHSNCAVWFGSFQPWKEVLGISNKAVGYVCLLDTDGKVRWKASGEPTAEDGAKLDAAIGELLLTL